MTLSEVQSNESLRQTEFPVARERVYLAHAGVCPLPQRVVTALVNYSGQATAQDQEAVMADGWMAETRSRAARLLSGAQPAEIAFVGPTSLALSYVANGLSFRRGQHVLVYQDDYPSNVYPWMALADRGIEVRFLNIKQTGCVRTADVLGQVDDDTRLVALPSCHFLAGWRLDLTALGRALRERGILLCVDGIQTLGAFPTSVEYIDFLAADAHKWMLGPCAAGVLYVRQSLQDQLRPTALGWHNVRCPNFVAQDELVLRPDARRYEAGTANLLGLVGLRAALDLLLEVGVDAIASDLLRKRAWLTATLRERGYTVLYPDAPPAHASGIVAFHRPGHEMRELHQRLLENRIVTSLRADRAGRSYVRLSPHFYNTEAELIRLTEHL